MSAAMGTELDFITEESAVWLDSRVGDWDPKCKDTGPCRVATSIRPVQSPRTYDLGMRLGTWDSELTDSCPQLAGECGGTWVASGSKGGPVDEGPIFTLDLGECDDPGSPPSPTSPKVRVIPTVSRRLVLAYRSKPSLLGEIHYLKRTVHEGQIQLRHLKIAAGVVEVENRKMARDIEDMEKPNCQSKSTNPQRTVRLRARIAGLKDKIGALQEKEEAQSDEITRLRTDARRSHTEEIEFERDIFFSEVGRLALLVQKLKDLCNLCMLLDDRDPTGSMATVAQGLEDKNKILEDGNKILLIELAKTTSLLRFNRVKAGEDIMEARIVEKQTRDLEQKNIRMAIALERRKKHNSALAKQLSKTEKAYRIANGGFF